MVNHSDAQLGSEDHRDEFSHKHAEEKCHEHHELIRDVDKLQSVHHHGSHVIIMITNITTTIIVQVFLFLTLPFHRLRISPLH